jgi:hypothetical protein
MREITPDRPSKIEHDTETRTRFFEAFDHKDAGGRVSALQFFDNFGIPKSTAYDWLNERQQLGRVANRRLNKRTYKQDKRRSSGPGRPPIIPNSVLNEIIHAPRETRRKKITTQLHLHGIHTCRETIRTALLNRKRARKFKTVTQKAITLPQQTQRTVYAMENRFKDVEGFWDGVMFTDEAHMALDDFPDDWILRVVGTRYEPENIVETTDKSGNVVHFAAWVNYYTKADELTFYNDEYDDVEPVKPPPKPRRRPTRETSEQYHDRVRQWEAEKARIPEVIKPGNSMRASYYTEKILPVYRDALYALQARSNELRGRVHRNDRYNWFIVEDNDPSHGTRNDDSLPAHYRKQHGMRRIVHPANSPDLNPIEGIWLVIKERVRRRLHEINSIAELKAALQLEWSRVRQETVQDRIKEMPWRCGQVLNHPETRVKTKVW